MKYTDCVNKNYLQIIFLWHYIIFQLNCKAHSLGFRMIFSPYNSIVGIKIYAHFSESLSRQVLFIYRISKNTTALHSNADIGPTRKEKPFDSNHGLIWAQMHLTANNFSFSRTYHWRCHYLDVLPQHQQIKLYIVVFIDTICQSAHGIPIEMYKKLQEGVGLFSCFLLTALVIWSHICIIL